MRFGIFEADLRAGELHKNGRKIRLQEQPFQILVMLLERSGEVVTRDELRQKLWPGSTFVDFDHGIRTAINKIRQALGDSADNPRFVETLPRRGYRFIAPVEPLTHYPSPHGPHGRGEQEVDIDMGRPAGPGEAPLTPVTPPAAWRSQAAVTDVGPVREPARRRPWVLALSAGTLAALLGASFGLNVAGLHDRLLTVTGARHGVSRPKIDSIVVLPLENLSHDPEQEYFADGMTEALITDLAKIRVLRVISRTSVMRYKRTKKPLPDIAKELNVNGIVEGTVQRSGDRVRVTANLLHAPTDHHVWAQTYERDLRDVLALQGEIAKAIAEEVKTQLTLQEQIRLTTTRPVNPEAYEAYLKGRHHATSAFTLESQLKGIKYFREAIEKDPGFAPAYAAMARCYANLAGWEYPPAREAWQKALDMAGKALQLDDKLAVVYTVYAEKKYFADWDWSGGLKEFRRAREMDPGYPDVIYHYGVGLEILGRFDQAIPEFRRAVQLDPLSHSANYFLAEALFNAHQDERAIAQYQEMLDLGPNDAIANMGLGSVYEALGRNDEAVSAYLKSMAVSGDGPEQVQACHDAYKTGGIRGFWKKRLDYLEAEAKGGNVSPLTLASFCMHAGQKRQALGWLQKAYREGIGDLVWVKADRTWDALRSDPRFGDLLRRMNFPPSAPQPVNGRFDDGEL